MLILSSTQFERHIPPPGHPERPERAHVFAAAAERWAQGGGSVQEPRAATQDELRRVHDEAYLSQLAGMGGRPAMLDADTFLSPESLNVARLAAGAAVQAAEHAFEHREPAFALVRPPGHHAEPERAMGFCLYNNVAVAAAAMIARGLQRVAIVDIDVHHGNGTQAMFYRDPQILYVSTHQYPFYPGTGAATEIGAQDGRGFTVNVPMDAGCTDADYQFVHDEIVEPVLDAFEPQLTLVSAGYDAHEQDPLASMRMTTAGYAAIVERLRRVAERHGAIALVTEGGYDLPALGACLEASIAVLDAARVQPQAARAISASARGERAVESARAALAPYWRGL
jgi:acetoin utilization deacetylase AcuC-like enzyme